MLGLSIVVGLATAAVIVYVVLAKRGDGAAQWTSERPHPRPLHAKSVGATALSADKLESFCAAQLERSGWQVQKVDQQRAQGVDMLAEKNGLVVALYCSKGWSPVDPAAVEKVAIATQAVGAEYGVVVSNSPYAREARRAADQRGIILMHYTELAVFDPALEE